MKMQRVKSAKYILIVLAIVLFQNISMAQQKIKYNDFRDSLISIIEGLNQKLPLTNISKNKILNYTIEKIDLLYGNGYNKDVYIPSSLEQFGKIYGETLVHYDNQSIFDWTLKKESDLYQLYSKGFTEAKFNIGDQNMIISCIIEELMARYPKANFDLNDDKFIQESGSIAKTCTRKYIDYENGTFEWNKYTIDAFKRQIHIEVEKELGSILGYSKIVNLSSYIVNGLITTFPKGLSMSQLQDKPVKDTIKKYLDQWFKQNNFL